MKIVSLNCNGTMRHKPETSNTLNADIYIIQECEDPGRSTEEWTVDKKLLIKFGVNRHNCVV